MIKRYKYRKKFENYIDYSALLQRHLLHRDLVAYKIPEAGLQSHFANIGSVVTSRKLPKVTHLFILTLLRNSQGSKTLSCNMLVSRL